MIGEETGHSLVHFLSNMSVCRVVFATLRRFESIANLGLFNSSPEMKPRERLVSLHRAGYWVAAAQLRVSRSATHHSFPPTVFSTVSRQISRSDYKTPTYVREHLQSLRLDC